MCDFLAVVKGGEPTLVYIVHSGQRGRASGRVPAMSRRNSVLPCPIGNKPKGRKEKERKEKKRKGKKKTKFLAWTSRAPLCAQNTSFLLWRPNDNTLCDRTHLGSA